MGEGFRRWCLFTSAGDHNAVRRWLAAGEPRRWDLVIGYYGDDDREYAALGEFAAYAFRDKGGKFQLLKRLIERQPDFFTRYGHVWVCDDDIEMTAAQIDEAFAITEQLGFWIAQPAFDDTGKVSYRITSSQAPRYDYRLVNFVETGAPIFRRDKLEAFLAVYDGSLVGWGIDNWFGNLFEADAFARFAIIDKVVVRNPHDWVKGGREIDRLQSTPLRRRAWYAVKAKYGLKEFPKRVFACGKLVPPAKQHSMPKTLIESPLEMLRKVPGWYRVRSVVRPYLAAQKPIPALAERLGYDKEARLLITHADDVGVTHSVTNACYDALAGGLVSSASIMVPCAGFAEAAALARAHPEFDLGIHLTLTSERPSHRWGPVAPREQVPSLVDHDGFFHRTWTTETRIAPREVEIELRAQIETALAAGLRPTHIDCHQYRLQRNGYALFEIYIRLGRDYFMPALMARDWLARSRSLVGVMAPDDALIDRVLSIGPEIAAQEWPDFYRRTLTGLAPGVTALLIHPGLDDAEMRAFSANSPDWGSAWRQRDYDFFTSQSCRDLLARQNIRLLTWREIGNSLTAG
jgi:chitin disaccharide deacetylase